MDGGGRLVTVRFSNPAMVFLMTGSLAGKGSTDVSNPRDPGCQLIGRADGACLCA